MTHDGGVGVTVQDAVRDEGLWVAHVDGTAVPNPGVIAVGVVLTAPDGSRHTVSKRLGLQGCNHQAEAHALATALTLALSLGARRLRALTDSAVVVEQTTGGRRTTVPRLMPIFADVRALLERFESATVEGIPRHHNSEADALARAASGVAPHIRRVSAHRRRQQRR